MSASPIYNIINVSGRKSNPSFGCVGFNQSVRVGTSPKNSHVLGIIDVQMLHINKSDANEFEMRLDGEVVRRGVVNSDGHFTITSYNKPTEDDVRDLADYLSRSIKDSPPEQRRIAVLPDLLFTLLTEYGE